MSNLEHYFENLLYEGLDYEDEINKRHLTPEEIEAVKTCAEYITYTFFNGKDELKKYINGEIDVVKTGKWIPVSESLPKINQQVLISTNDGNVFAGHRLIPDTLWQVDDWDNKKAWVYDPERYTDNIDDLPRCEDCAFETNPDGILMAVISMNYNPSQRGVVAWMPFPEPYKEQMNCGERMAEE